MKPGANLTIGAEVKSTLSMADSRKIDDKIGMCGHPGMIPAFAARWINPHIDRARK